MREVVIHIEPPEVETDDFEDLLATDDMFVEYFNAFLQLPSFPEPLCFNKETGGFEVVTDAKKQLASQIKAAVRAGRRRKRIYRPVKNHSFMDIPLIPMVEPPLQEEMEIDTSFTVKTLNREQGIEWIKVERLPAFLESDIYLEYRLAKLVSQAQIAGRPEEYVTLKVDYRPRIKKKPVTVEKEPEINETEILMKDMFVSMGNATPTDTEAWVSQAKMVQNTDTTVSTGTRPTSAFAVVSIHRPNSARPLSALSMLESCRRTDSGIGSPTKSLLGSMLDATTYTNSIFSMEDREDMEELEEDVYDSKLFDPNSKPITPRPSDMVCMLAEGAGHSGRVGGSAVYAQPKAEDVEEEEEDVIRVTPVEDRKDLPEDILEKIIAEERAGGENNAETQDEGKVPETILGTENEAGDESSDTVTVSSMDEVGAVIVGTVLKYAFAEVSGKDIHTVEQSAPVQNFFPNRRYSDLPREKLEKTVFIVDPTLPAESFSIQSKSESQKPVLPVKKERKKEVQLKEEKDSDEDSLLNSDDDYEEEDMFFRRRKNRTFMLTTRKGLEEFKKFLVGTIGQKMWSFWLDIDRGRLIKDTEGKLRYLAAMRERYHKHGAPYELSHELKLELGLTEPSQWTFDKLFMVQKKISEPLVLYWAPRFLIKQTVQVNPEKNKIYHQQQQIRPRPDPYPNPPTASLLPLRPKTCMPRVRQHTQEITDAFEASKEEDQGGADKVCLPVTTPLVGMKRTYSIPDMFKSEKTEKEKQNKERKRRDKKCPKQLISAILQVDQQQQMLEPHPPSTPSSRGKDRNKPSNMSADEWETQSNTSLRSIKSITSRKSSSVVSTVSEFQGGRRMEGLLQALGHEKKAGNFFRKFVTSTGNKLWMHCVCLWEELQDYHKMFYEDVLDTYLLEKKAQAINAQYIVYGAPLTIDCSRPIIQQIQRQIQPPYEDLFDGAEEYCLEVLYDAWSQMIVSDMSTFDKVELIDVKRHLEAKSKYVVTLQRRGIIKERVMSPDSPMEGYEDPIYDESLLERIPEQFRDYSLEKLVHNRLELEHYRQFLTDNYASMDLMCWMDIEAFKRIPHTDQKRRDLKNKDIKVKYMNKKYFFGPNSPAGKEGQDKVMAAGGGWGKLLEDKLPPVILLEAQKYVQARLEQKWLPIFLATEEFAERQKPRGSMDDVVEDIMLQRKKKSQAIWKMLESRWVSSSKDIVTFRKALTNPVTSLQFRRYVSIKGDNLENDVLFWQEVQRYKDLCHLHSDRSLVQQKTVAIVNCFLDSNIPPALQIDIPQEMADKVIERKLEATPYLFREAQLTVFRVLFSHWNDFCGFRTNLADDKILPTIERHRRRAKAKERAQQKRLEEHREKEAARRNAAMADGDEYDPFEKVAHGSDVDGMDEGSDKHMSWSYSQYVQALDQEEVLNNVDLDTFSSLSSKGDAIPNENIDTRASTPVKDHADTQKRKKEEKTKKQVKVVEEGEDRAKSGKVKPETAETGSQTDAKQKHIQKKARVTSPKDQVKSTEKHKAYSHSLEVHGDKTASKTAGKAVGKTSDDKAAKAKQTKLVPPLTAQKK